MKISYLVSALLVLFLSGCKSLEEDLNKPVYHDPIKVAFLGPFSEVRMGAEGKFLGAFLAAEEINQSGGILGRDIELIQRDDAGSGEQGVIETKKLYAENINLILGADWSSVTLAVANEVTIKNNMLLISYSSTNPDISNLDDNDLVWRTCPSDIFQAKTGASFCYNQLGKRHAAILCLDNPWAKSLSNVFQETFLLFGGEVSQFVIYPELFGDDISNYDYTSHLDSLFKGNPDVIYFSGFPAEGAKISHDIARNSFYSSGHRPLFFSNDGLYSNYFTLNGHQGVIDGFRGTVPGSPAEDPNYAKYAKNFQNRWGFSPVAFSEYAYDALYLLAYSILKAQGDTDPNIISSYLREVSGKTEMTNAVTINIQEFQKAFEIISSGGDINYNGASGIIDFDENGDPSSGNYLLWEIKNGHYMTDTIITFPK